MTTIARAHNSTGRLRLRGGPVATLPGIFATSWKGASMAKSGSIQEPARYMPLICRSIGMFRSLS
jgi:hypothetical protein